MVDVVKMVRRHFPNPKYKGAVSANKCADELERSRHEVDRLRRIIDGKKPRPRAYGAHLPEEGVSDVS